MITLRDAVPADYERLSVGLPPQGLMLPETGLVSAPAAALLAQGCERLRQRLGWGACLVTEAELLVGLIGLRAVPDQAGEAEFGYSVSPGQRGRGVAGAAVAAFVDRAIDQGLAALVAETDPGNAASMRVLQRNQFAPVPQAGSGRLRWRRQLRR